MKTPLRFQITEYEIPALLVKQIHKYTLDCYDKDGHLGNGGTSREAVDKLSTWITKNADENDFNVKCEHLVFEDVNYDNISKCIEEGGVVLVRVWQTTEHYVIITKIKNTKVYIFDPYYLDKNYYNRDRMVKIVLNKPFSHNRVVSIKRLFSETQKDFSLGPAKDRECVLINRKV